MQNFTWMSLRLWDPSRHSSKRQCISQRMNYMRNHSIKTVVIPWWIQTQKTKAQFRVTCNPLGRREGIEVSITTSLYHTSRMCYIHQLTRHLEYMFLIANYSLKSTDGLGSLTWYLTSWTQLLGLTQMYVHVSMEIRGRKTYPQIRRG